MSDIKNRKKDHVELTTDDQTQYELGTGFEEYYFNHNALPELNFDEISVEARLLGRTFSFPLFISSMTGGYADAGPVNAIIARVCEKRNLPFGVGSQRAMLEDPSLTDTFSIVRKHAPEAFICSNIGGAQLISPLNEKDIHLITDSIQADAIIIHLNPLQEMMQPEGDRNFKGIINGIEDLKKKTDLPLMVKETGAGISGHVARKLLNAGVDVLDIAGAGGTSWAKVENMRDSNENPEHQFNNWGIPTAVSLKALSRLEWERKFEIIASGGIRNAFDMAKSLCLGAHFTATAQPVIKVIKESGEEGLVALLNSWEKDLKTILLLLGVKNIQFLNDSHLLKKA